jgi:hypothetical protein
MISGISGTPNSSETRYRSKAARKVFDWGSTWYIPEWARAVHARFPDPTLETRRSSSRSNDPLSFISVFSFSFSFPLSTRSTHELTDDSSSNVSKWIATKFSISAECGVLVWLDAFFASFVICHTVSSFASLWRGCKRRAEAEEDQISWFYASR